VYKRQGTAIEVPICQHQPVPYYFQPNELRTRGEIRYIYTDTESTKKTKKQNERKETRGPFQVQAIHFISAAAEFQLSRGLWVLIDPDNVPVNENPLQWLHKLRQKTANYQAKDRSALHCIPQGSAPVPCNMHEYYAEEPPTSVPS
jgi:hypothetical protein